MYRLLDPTQKLCLCISYHGNHYGTRKRPEFRTIRNAAIRCDNIAGDCSVLWMGSARDIITGALAIALHPSADVNFSPTRVYGVVCISRNHIDRAGRTIRLHQQIIMSAVHCDQRLPVRSYLRSQQGREPRCTYLSTRNRNKLRGQAGPGAIAKRDLGTSEIVSSTEYFLNVKIAHQTHLSNRAAINLYTNAIFLLHFRIVTRSLIVVTQRSNSSIGACRQTRLANV